MFHSLPSLHLKGYQPYSFSYGFPMVWTVFRHRFRLLFWKMSEKDHIASLYGWVPAAFCMPTAWSRHFLSLSPIEEATVPVEILSIIYCKNNLRIDYKKRLTCFYELYRFYLEFVCNVVTTRACGFLNIMLQPNGGILDTKIILMEQKENVWCNWESRQYKHPKIIKGKRFVLLLFWLSWPIYFAASCL